MEKLKISVIIPSYNQGAFLEETLLSVLDQDYENKEVIIIDGGSSDNSPSIIKKYGPRLTYSLIEKDNGQSHAINKGLSIATGDIITWLCSDDIYTPNTLSTVGKLFSELPEEVGLIHGNSLIFDSKKYRHLDKGYSEQSLERRLSGMAFPQPSSFMRRKYLEKTGRLNESLHYGMDYDLFSRLSMLCRFHYHDFLFSRYRLHQSSKSMVFVDKFISEWSIVFCSILNGFHDQPTLFKLRELELATPTDAGIVNFFKSHPAPKELNFNKLLYYFLCNLIRFDYASGKLSRCRKIGRYLKSNFSAELQKDRDILLIVNRSSYFPKPILLAIRYIKHL